MADAKMHACHSRRASWSMTSDSRINRQSAETGTVVRGGSFPRRLQFSDFAHAESAPNGLVCCRL